MKFRILILLLVIGFSSCLNQAAEIEDNQVAAVERAKFEPQEGKVLLFVGQELDAIGGLESPYDNGYLDHFERPAGFTMYTNFTPGDVSFSYELKGLDGLKFEADWGDSPSHMDRQLADPDFTNMALAIGLSLVGQEDKVANGERDDLIREFGEWAKSLGDRPVFLRIGYEFDGHSWNHYEKEAYIKAFRRIKDMLDDQEVMNIAYVWQSTGWVSDQFLLEEWYPGDEYVDWCATSFFARWKEIEMFEFARKKNKPVFIAEATPTIPDHLLKFDGSTKETILSNDEQAKEAWEKWFIPFFNTINENRDVIKAISYINCNWRSHEMWFNNPTFRYIDSRIQTSAYLDSMWRTEISKDTYIHSSEDLYEYLKAVEISN